MKLDSIAEFVQLMSRQGKTWNPAAFFDANVERWLPVWENAHDDEKQALAHSYIWAHANFGDSRYPHDGHTRWAENVWTGQYKWLREIQPYVDLTYITKENIGANYELLANVLGGSTRESSDIEYIRLRALWHGNTKQRQHALVELLSNVDKAPFFATGNLIPVLAWDLAAETNDVHDIKNAILSSYFAGRSGYKPPQDCTDVHRSWATLGYLDYRCNKWGSYRKRKEDGSTMSREEQWAEEFAAENIVQSDELILGLQASPAEPAALALKQLLPKIGMDCGNDGYAIYSHTYLGFLLEDQEGNTMAYDLLRCVVPSKNGLWDAADLVDQNVMDAIDMASKKPEPLENVQLPTDVLSFQEI